MKENIVATTQDWLKVTEGRNITAYYPSVGTEYEYTAVSELNQAINLPAAERAGMNCTNPGVPVSPKHL
ncbi:MAG TPA: hypothetical protein VNE63_13730 [Candidatus Acidoferrales bacterium]|nr:hypothetical protein [Candidatus Acidoferrales bacterium]